MTTFLVLQDSDGEFRPMGFISPNNEAGKMRAEDYEKKLDEGEKIVEVKMELV